MVISCTKFSWGGKHRLLVAPYPGVQSFFCCPPGHIKGRVRMTSMFSIRRYIKFGVYALAIAFLIGLALKLAAWLTGTQPWQNAPAIGALATAIGVLLAFVSLRSTHDWNRRH